MCCCSLITAALKPVIVCLDDRASFFKNWEDAILTEDKST